MSAAGTRIVGSSLAASQKGVIFSSRRAPFRCFSVGWSCNKSNQLGCRRTRRATSYTTIVGTDTSKGWPLFHSNIPIRWFQTVGEYHNVADETLDCIQDAIEDMMDDSDIDDVEVTVASGVLTLVIPRQGTWVINKQTPNKQIWWSSPLSGPRRYEYNATSGHWVYTRSQQHNDEKDEESLGNALTQEMKQVLDLDLNLDV